MTPEERALLRVLVNSGGKPQQISEDEEEKPKGSRFLLHLGFLITAVPPKVSKTPFCSEGLALALKSEQLNL
ncbi:MAG TPA: hypothetical protein VHZ51_22400 [Ktedonobacteraceae bacterium]|nr:hypothetical protein [Ktedonobacteraceae bacterium]